MNSDGNGKLITLRMKISTAGCSSLVPGGLTVFLGFSLGVHCWHRFKFRTGQHLIQLHIITINHTDHTVKMQILNVCLRLILVTYIAPPSHFAHQPAFFLEMVHKSLLAGA